MALTANEQKFADWIKKIIPRHYFADTPLDELAAAFAKMFEDARQENEDLFEQTYILTAVGGSPDWLNLHAMDRGTQRQGTELDATLRERLRTFEDAVSVPALLDAINDILVAAGFPATAAIVELRTDKAFMLTNVADTGTGGVFSLISGTTFKFTPTVPFDPPLTFNDNIVFTGATSAGNNGNYEVVSLEGNGVIYVNAAGVAGADGAVTWTYNRNNPQGYSVEGFKDAYLSRGYRMATNGLNGIIIILPYNSTAAVEAAVRAALGAKKAAGLFVIVERRLVP